MVICGAYINSSHDKDLSVVGSIVVVDALTYCSLFHSVYGLKDTDKNIMLSSSGLMLSELERGHSAEEIEFVWLKMKSQ